MKSSLLLAALIALTLTACGKKEVPPAPVVAPAVTAPADVTKPADPAPAATAPAAPADASKPADAAAAPAEPAKK